MLAIAPLSNSSAHLPRSDAMQSSSADAIHTAQPMQDQAHSHTLSNTSHAAAASTSSRSPLPATHTNRSSNRSIIAAVRAALEDSHVTPSQWSSSASTAAAVSTDTAAAAAASAAPRASAAALPVSARAANAAGPPKERPPEEPKPRSNSWFSLNHIHRLERDALPEFFMTPESDSLRAPPSVTQEEQASATGAAPVAVGAIGNSNTAPAPTLPLLPPAFIPAVMGSSGGGGGAGMSSSFSSSSPPSLPPQLVSFPPPLQPPPRRRPSSPVFHPFRSPYAYKALRDWMYIAYHSNPTIYLHLITCLKFIAADFGTIWRVHAFLEREGLINRQEQVQMKSKPYA